MGSTLEEQTLPRPKQHSQVPRFSMKTTYQTRSGIGNHTIMKFRQSHLLLEMVLNSHRNDFEHTVQNDSIRIIKSEQIVTDFSKSSSLPSILIYVEINHSIL